MPCVSLIRPIEKATSLWPLNPYLNPATLVALDRSGLRNRLVSAITVNHEDSRWELLADLFDTGLTVVDRIVPADIANRKKSATLALPSVSGFTNMFTGTSFLLIYEQYMRLAYLSSVFRGPEVKLAGWTESSE
ncbi:hypothetical protein BIW11_03024 [Tropilaelaps mercedesae]|uniref:Uncharacterized protein n=1 Tax=Tropilaelaps mercedesae TaxID=418985 RepID=A0A1V9XT75_9ACAR|nr:hypothetical protein BIW11_03024 [Tropilaelaps mercedesae]